MDPQLREYFYAFGGMTLLVGVSFLAVFFYDAESRSGAGLDRGALKVTLRRVIIISALLVFLVRMWMLSNVGHETPAAAKARETASTLR
jgi:hypothetical protein